MQPRDKLGEGDSYYALAINKVSGTLVDLEATPMFELLEDSMHKDLIPYVEANLVSIFEAPYVETWGNDQIFAYDFIYVHVGND